MAKGGDPATIIIERLMSGVFGQTYALNDNGNKETFGKKGKGSVTDGEGIDGTGIAEPKAMPGGNVREVRFLGGLGGEFACPDFGDSVEYESCDALVVEPKNGKRFEPSVKDGVEDESAKNFANGGSFGHKGSMGKTGGGY